MNRASFQELQEFCSQGLPRMFSKARASHAPKSKQGSTVFGIVDDAYSEAVHFRFDVRGVTYRALVTYDALRDHHDACAPREPELALFIRHANKIAASATAQLARARTDPVIVERIDL